MELPEGPISEVHGYDRGTPVDRYYIAQFLTTCAEFIRGEVAELKDDRYCRQYGRSAGRVAIIDIDRANPNATLFVDLVQEASLPPVAFDCIICTQAAQFFKVPTLAIQNFWRALKPGGSLLLTVPAVGRLIAPTAEVDYWRFNPSGARQLFDMWAGSIDFVYYGNLRACLGMLIGEAAEEIGHELLDKFDPAFPLVTCARAVKQ